jgi:hypothetical protein
MHASNALRDAFMTLGYSGGNDTARIAAGGVVIS